MGQSWQKKGIDRLQIESSVAHHLGKSPHFQKGCKISERHRKVVEGMDIYRTEKKKRFPPRTKGTDILGYWNLSKDIFERLGERRC